MPYRLGNDVWLPLFVRGVLLEGGVDHLGPFADLLRTRSVPLRSVFDELNTIGAHAAVATGERAARSMGAKRWRERLTDVLRAPNLSPREKQVCRALHRSRPSTADPYGALFALVADRAAELYGMAWPGPPKFEVLSMSGQPSPPYALNGETRPQSADVVVRLLLNPDELGPATFLAIPAVLVHECVCHVLDVAAGRPIHNESPFSEGAMDWLAAYHLRRWLPLICPRMAAPAEQHAQLFSAAVVAHGIASNARMIGWTAAGELVTQVMAVPGLAPPEDRRAAAETRVASFIRRLALSGVDPLARDALVQRIELGRLTLDDPTLRKVVLDEVFVDPLF